MIQEKLKELRRGASFIGSILSSVVYVFSTHTHIKNPPGDLLPLTTGRMRGRR